MTSVLPEEKSNVTRLKQKSQLHNTQSIGKSCMELSTHDETRSFLNFSRENLSISNSEFEQGFNKAPRLRCYNRQTLLSCVALLLALSCAGLELWKLRCVLAIARDVETLKRDVDTLKHRFLEKDLLDELKAFEEQLYSEDLNEEDDSSSMPSPNNSDYDSNYDESSTSPASSLDYQTDTSITKNLGTGDSSSAGTASLTTLTPCTSKNLEDVLAMLRRAEAERGQVFEQSVRQKEKLFEQERTSKQRNLVGEHYVSGEGEKNKRQISGEDRTKTQNFFIKLKHPLDKWTQIRNLVGDELTNEPGKF